MAVDWSVLIVINCTDFESKGESPTQQSIDTPSKNTYCSQSGGGPIRRPLFSVNRGRRFGNLVYRPNKIQDASSIPEESNRGLTAPELKLSAPPLGSSRDPHEREHTKYDSSRFYKDNRRSQKFELASARKKSRTISAPNTAPIDAIDMLQRLKTTLVEKHTKRRSASMSSESSTEA